MTSIREQIEQLRSFRVQAPYGDHFFPIETKQAAETMEKMLAVVMQFQILMAESHGVDGLHLNGDIATWEWLENNEWLESLAALDEKS